MKKDEIIQAIRESEDLLPKGFSLSLEDDPQGIGVGIHNKNEYTLNRISVWINKNNAYSKFIPGINHLKIEEIVQPIFAQCKLGTGMYIETAYSTMTMEKFEVELFNQVQPHPSPKSINSESDVSEFIQKINMCIDKISAPFFKKWGDLRFLNDFIDNVPQMELSNFFGMGATYKKATLYKLCNNPRFYEYFDWLYNGLINKYAKNPEGDIAIKRKRDAVIALKEGLDKTKPIY